MQFCVQHPCNFLLSLLFVLADSRTQFKFNFLQFKPYTVSQSRKPKYTRIRFIWVSWRHRHTVFELYSLWSMLLKLPLFVPVYYVCVFLSVYLSRDIIMTSVRVAPAAAVFSLVRWHHICVPIWRQTASVAVYLSARCSFSICYLYSVWALNHSSMCTCCRWRIGLLRIKTFYY